MFTLDQVVPWGRSFAEYRQMFALSADDLAGTIVGCADGPASFNAEATAMGVNVVSCDPLYRFGVDEIRQRISVTYDEIMEQTRANSGEFVWTTISSVDALGRLRMEAMDLFLQDYPAGRESGRYLDAALPSLPLADRSAPLALSSHFLFLYSTGLGEAFHHAAIREMCRVADEVRIFPLLALGGSPSPFIESCLEACRARGLQASIERVPYEFQRGGNQMMRICRPRGQNAG